MTMGNILYNTNSLCDVSSDTAQLITAWALRHMMYEHKYTLVSLTSNDVIETLKAQLLCKMTSCTKSLQQKYSFFLPIIAKHLPVFPYILGCEHLRSVTEVVTLLITMHVLNCS